MQARPTAFPDVLLIEPRIFGDARGFFYESFNERSFAALTGLDPVPHFVQDNHSRSARNVLRGLHYQVRQAQGKLIRVSAGSILDVVVDVRRSSPNFGRHMCVELGAEKAQQLWVPAGYAHGFIVLSEMAEVLYKTTDYWAPEHERTLLWNDPALAIAWPADAAPILSDKDRQGKPLSEAEVYP